MFPNSGTQDRQLHALQQQLLTLDYPDVLVLQLPEIPDSRAVGEDFWELQSKNTWIVHGWGPVLQKTCDCAS